MDTNSGYNPQFSATGEDYQASDTQATIDWNMYNHEIPHAQTSAGGPHFDMSTERILSRSAAQAGLHGERPGQSYAVLSDAYVSSLVFSPNILHNNQQPNTILYSSDNVHFYVHTSLLLSVSNNNFGNLIYNDGATSSHNPIILSTAVSSDVLDISLRMIYLIEFPPDPPTFSTCENAVRFMKQHGIAPLSEWIGPASHMFAALISLAPEHMLEIYTLAAVFDIEPLAAYASSFLLKLPWSSISEETAGKIGGVYMKRLGNLQVGRMNALKHILLPGPSSHPIQGSGCSEEGQTSLARSYALTATYVCWDANADLPVSHIEETFEQLINKLTCPMCKDGLNRRIKESVEAWTGLKRTI